MDWYRIFGMLGVLGPCLCICGDLLLDLKGPENRKLGKYGIVDSQWPHMALSRFLWSIVFGSFGAALSGFGFVAMAHRLSDAHRDFAIAYFLIAMFGAAGGVFIHDVICLLPVLWKKVEPLHGPEEAESIVNTVYEAVRLPFWVLYMALVAVPSLMVLFALWNGWLGLSRWWMLATPPALMLLGGVLQKLFPRACCDLPMVIAPSLGLVCMNLMALL